MLLNLTAPRRLKTKIVSDLYTFFFPDLREIHYIGGADILPAPLDTKRRRLRLGILEAERMKEQGSF